MMPHGETGIIRISTYFSRLDRYVLYVICPGTG